MHRRLPLPAAVASVFAIALPAAADGARPDAPSFYNGDPSRGLYLETTRKTITSLSLYCTLPDYEVRQNRYDLRDTIRIRRGGRFSFKGVANRYGPEGTWLGRFDVRVKGRFTSPTRVKMERRLEGCGTATITANAEG
jgi:hypothetical protein